MLTYSKCQHFFKNTYFLILFAVLATMWYKFPYTTTQELEFMGNSATRWKPGQSGNPGGMTSEARKLILETRLLALRQCPRIIKKLIKCVESGTFIDKRQFVAMREILDRGIGRPVQQVELAHDNTESLSPINMTTEQLRLAASGMTRELIQNIIASGKIEEYTGSEVKLLRIEKDVTESCKEEHDNSNKAKEGAREELSKDGME